MFYIDNQGINDPRINLAIEEHVLRNFAPDHEYLMLYVNEPSVIMGKHQNIYEEVNVDFVQQNNIKVVRRVSGGGTVYHDLGNLNFSFLVPHDSSKLNNYHYFLDPIVEALQSLGVPAEISPRNDLMAAGKKISGNAQFSTTKRMVSHGTLLFNSEIIHLSQSLKAKTTTIQSKSIKSVRSPVANVYEYLSSEQQSRLNMEEFKKVLLQYIFKTQPNEVSTIPTYTLTQDDWEVVNKLVKEKYNTWEWNYARSPKCSIHKTHQFDWGTLAATVDIKKGHIQGVNFEGAHHSELQAMLAQLAKTLTQVKFDKNSLKKAIATANIEEDKLNIKENQILQLVWQ
ncbi:lipoate--protein ligase [uncultured Microscilla sp.]|uniref:lipoate--protein ligase n=1 Tax=uncultured Microscilla sp. TaxID=432653 RepID=UPI00260BEA16|nr:lipoate--protein ligase [uncultured Microscilla sp.]